MLSLSELGGKNTLERSQQKKTYDEEERKIDAPRRERYTSRAKIDVI